MQQAAHGDLKGRPLSPTLALHDARPQGRMRAGSGEMTSEGIPPPLPCSRPGSALTLPGFSTHFTQ